MILLQEGLLQNVTTGDTNGPFRSTMPVTLNQNNIAKARLWLDLKYRNGLPALEKMKVISKPSRRIFASPDECRYIFTLKFLFTNQSRAIASARQASSLLKGQVLGQITILNTPYGIIEMKDALLKGVGGEVLCYAA
jgi:ribosomal protein S8